MKCGLAGAKIAGHRGYFLTNDGIDLNQALITYALDFLRKRSYKKIQPPFKPSVSSPVVRPVETITRVCSCLMLRWCFTGRV